MGLLVPKPAAKGDLWSAGYNGFGDFIIGTEDGAVIRVPNEWRAALAAWLIGDIGIFDPHTVRYLRELQQRATKKRGGKLEAADAETLRKIAHGLECLIQEHIEANPRINKRFSYTPTYPKAQPEEDRASDEILEAEEVDDTPMPWEAAKA